MRLYDQRWISSGEGRFTSGSKNVKLCEVCGDNQTCNILASLGHQAEKFLVNVQVSACGLYAPVLSFRDGTGLSGTFNTFRRGQAWHARVEIGRRVRMFSLEMEEFLGSGVVKEKFLGSLSDLLPRHAAMNHLMKGDLTDDAPDRLMKVLQVLYGKNFASADTIFSVLYIETG